MCSEVTVRFGHRYGLLLPGPQMCLQYYNILYSHLDLNVEARHLGTWTSLDS